MGNATSCPSPHTDQDQDLHHQGTSHKPLLILSTACTAITLCSAAALATLHLLNYRAPREQRQIVKILLAPFVFALVSLAQILSYPAAAYVDPISSAYEAVCLCALFLLYVQFAAGPGNGTFGEELFEAVRAAQETGPAAEGNDGDGRSRRGNWPKATWAAVFQYPVTELVAIVVLEVTEATGTYCSTSLRPRYGHFWASLIHSVGLVVAVVSLVRFHGRMKGRMRARRGLAKLGCFKAMVALRFLQTWIFNILIDQDVLQPSSVFSYGDLLYGLPNALLCVESVVFSAVFWYAFSATEYKDHPEARLGFWRAGLDAANPLDLLRGIARAVGLVASLSRRRDREIAPMRRADRGKYRTLEEGMESLERPGRSRSRTPLGEFERRDGRYYEV